MTIYQHDSATAFRFALVGALEGEAAVELEQAWQTASSVMKDKELLVDLKGLTGADQAGVEVLCRMREAGARFPSAPKKVEQLGPLFANFKPTPQEA